MVWHLCACEEAASRGSGEITSCLLKVTGQMLQRKQKLILYSNSYCGQNINIIILSLLHCLAQSWILQ
jgi:hypothetical protein